MDDPPRDIGCAECIDLLSDYVDGILPEKQAKALEWHIESCPPCVAFVNTYRGTIDAARKLGDVEIPSELKKRLLAVLKSGKAPQQQR